MSEYYLPGLYNGVCLLKAAHIHVSWLKKMRPMLAVILGALIADHWRFAVEKTAKGDYSDFWVTLSPDRYSLGLGINERTLRRGVEELASRGLIEWSESDTGRLSVMPLYEAITLMSGWSQGDLVRQMEEAAALTSKPPPTIPLAAEPPLETYLL